MYHITPQTAAIAANVSDEYFNGRTEPVTLDDYNDIQFPVARVRRNEQTVASVVGDIYDIYTLMTCAGINGLYPDTRQVIIWNELEAIVWTPIRPKGLPVDYVTRTEEILNDMQSLERNALGHENNTLIRRISERNYLSFRKAMALQTTRMNCPEWIIWYWRYHSFIPNEFGSNNEALDTAASRFNGARYTEEQYRDWRICMALAVINPKSLWYQYWINHPLDDNERVEGSLMRNLANKHDSALKSNGMTLNGKRSITTDSDMRVTRRTKREPELTELMSNLNLRM